MVLPVCCGYEPLPPWGGEGRNGKQAADPYSWAAIKQQEITPSTLKSMGGAAVLMVHSIPASCLRCYLPGARFSDTWWDFYGSCAARNSNAHLPVGMMVGGELALLCWNFTLVCDSDSDAVDMLKKVKDGVYCWHHAWCTLENKKERK